VSRFLFRGTLSDMAGRPPDAGASRKHYLRVRLAEFEAIALDTARQSMSRSDYVRELIRRDAANQGCEGEA
jgi:hypothetical protein